MSMCLMALFLLALHQVAADAMSHSGLVAKLLVTFNPKGLDHLVAVCCFWNLRARRTLVF